MTIRPTTSPGLVSSSKRGRILDGFKNAEYSDCIKVDDSNDDNNNNNCRPKSSSQQHRLQNTNNTNNSSNSICSKPKQSKIVETNDINADNFWNTRLTKKRSHWGTAERSKT